MPDGTLALTIAELLAIIVASVISGGGMVGIGVVGLVKIIRNDPSAMVAVEKLGDSVPREHADNILEFTRGAKEIAILAEEALDGIPASEKVIVPDEPVVLTASNAAVLTSDYVAKETGNTDENGS